VVGDRRILGSEEPRESVTTCLHVQMCSQAGLRPSAPQKVAGRPVTGARRTESSPHRPAAARLHQAMVGRSFACAHACCTWRDTVPLQLRDPTLRKYVLQLQKRRRQWFLAGIWTHLACRYARSHQRGEHGLAYRSTAAVVK
jgi:hypothetical protein